MTYDTMWCYASYENDQVCMSCRQGDKEDGIMKCSALISTEPYTEKCPFFCPMCVHRTNDRKGFKSCAKFAFKKKCPGKNCTFYEPIKKGVSL